MFVDLLIVAHVLSVFWLLGGILGRNLTAVRASGASTVQEVRTLFGLSHVFETRMIRPGTAAVLVAGLLAAWARGWPILGFLQGGKSNWVLVSLAIYLSIIPLIAFVFVPRGRIFQRALEEAVTRDEITPALRAAMDDPVVAGAHVYEIAMVVVLTVLMVTRPF